MKPEKPITRKEMYLDVATGGSTELPSPVTREEKYLAKIAGESVDVPTPVTRYEMLLAAVAGESYTLTPVTRLEIYLAKAAGQDVEIPQPVTREEMYWFDYCGGTPTPPVQEYTGAVPVTFTADGTPLLDYLISGNTVQSGTPTPDNPIIPQGTGERTGNLWDEEYPNISGTIRYVPLYVGEGSFTLSTTTPYDSSVANLFLLSGNVSTGASASGNGAWINHNVTAQSDGGYITIAYRHYASTTSPADCKTMLNTGSTALPYEPFGVKIPILSGGVTTPVYLGEVQTVRQIKKVVFTGSVDETWNRAGSTHGYFTNLPSTAKLVGASGIISSHYQPSMSGADGTIRVAQGSVEALIYDNYTSVADFKAYLAAQYANGTPVTIWYVLANPETTVVNEPLMKIGDYADTLSKAQAGVEIPTVNGSTTLDVETTVPPSEIYIKYRGDAVATLSTLSAEVSNPEATEEVNPEEMEETENGSEDVSL